MGGGAEQTLIHIIIRIINLQHQHQHQQKRELYHILPTCTIRMFLRVIHRLHDQKNAYMCSIIRRFVHGEKVLLTARLIQME